MTSLETVAITRQGAAAVIQLSRPEALNAWNAQMSRDLLLALQDVGSDPEIRAVALTGAGRAFCSGADLKAPEGGAQGHKTPDLGASLRERYNPVILAVRALEKPVVAAVNGPAVGVGCSLALAADLVVAAHSAYFLLAFVNIGLAPDGGASAFLPDRVGLARANEMAMLGERVAADDALAWGLVNRVVPDGDLAGTRDSLLARLAAGPTRAHAAIKRQLAAWTQTRLAEQLELEAVLQAELGRSSDFAEGVAAFSERRPARFSAR